MAAEDIEDDIDVETLQAQVDMSMAFTQNLVSSWLESSRGKLPSVKSSRNEEKELEEYMRRPPRLGVGAAPPDATSMLGRDTARLKNKLVGRAGKKRARDQDGDIAMAAPSDEEEESRASVVKKKARIDVLSKKPKGNKSRNMETANSKKASSPMTPVKQEVAKEQRVAEAPRTPRPVADEEGQQLQPKPSIPSLSLPKKKKKKRLNETNLTAVDSPIPSTSQQPLKSNPQELKTETPPTIDLLGQDEVDAEAAQPVKPPTSLRTSAKPFHNATGQLAFPLLNLRGPSKEAEDAVTASPKKRHRRKKKKAAVADARADDSDSDD
ncbi:hypothetical protein WOLCODRAFT_131939 [Wolfiporia cocos MD-104 SS10]|uniref:Uncharacterized protein n=1 Tax=Wolfiporia cocos (strain MD-104) TaxID=742152 RepID=A0A2H3JHX1_WOLCO|nr:hypothetical protein WOLCODRAFT_131939 [Wolfiporia cocos MD-104 SS10]